MKAKSLLVKSFVGLVVLMTGCRNEDSLEAYAEKLGTASRPGHYTQRFVAPFLDQSPQYYLVKSFQKLSSRWQHVEETNEQDNVQCAETMFENDFYGGDCEDFAVCMMAICRYRGLNARYGLGKSVKDSTRGHVWVEVAISPSDELDKKLENHLKALDNSFRIVDKQGIKWLRFSDEPIESLYKMTHYVTGTGILKEVKASTEPVKTLIYN